MAQVETKTEETPDPKQLYSEGILAYGTHNYEKAISLLGEASELLAKANGEEDDSVGDAYLYYGRSLLEYYRQESGYFGEAVLAKVKERQAEVDKAEKEQEKEGDKHEQTNGVSEDSQEEGEEGGEETVEGEEDKVEEENDEEKTEEENGEENEVEDGDEEKTEEETEQEGGEQKEEETQDDLQVAWEVLEIAKRIFTKRGDGGKRDLSECLITLGEISLENGNYPLAVEDISQGVEIQKTLSDVSVRIMAQSYFTLGGAYASDGQIDKAVESYQMSYDCLKTRLENLEKDTENYSTNEPEICELTKLLPDVEEKILDMKSVKEENAQKPSKAEANEVAFTNGQSSSSSSSAACDISHLVKRKRKPEDDIAEEQPAKKAA